MLQARANEVLAALVWDLHRRKALSNLLSTWVFSLLSAPPSDVSLLPPP